MLGASNRRASVPSTPATDRLATNTSRFLPQKSYASTVTRACGLMTFSLDSPQPSSRWNSASGTPARLRKAPTAAVPFAHDPLAHVPPAEAEAVAWPRRLQRLSAYRFTLSLLARPRA